MHQFAKLARHPGFSGSLVPGSSVDRSQHLSVSEMTETGMPQNKENMLTPDDNDNEAANEEDSEAEEEDGDFALVTGALVICQLVDNE